MDGAEREDAVADNNLEVRFVEAAGGLNTARYWRGTLTRLALVLASVWCFNTVAWFAIEARKLMWEERMEAGVQITPACTWAPESPRFEPALEACPLDPFEPLKPDGLLIPKRKFLPEPEIDLGDPEELPLVKPAVRVHLL